ncbi:MAG TPA: phage tail sheath C-terminal domain-containing protein [Anaerolineaceae bacterium]|nr:phage tail sheath C-terminal domain-containing protein [Anaerolineaceae bacterium]
MSTPGVYTVEKHAFPTSVVEVATAVPVFIGHTEFAAYKGTSLKGKPWRIASLSEYHSCFGVGPKDLFELDATGAATRKTPAYRMYQALRFYFQNGGGPCYIVSTGGYTDAFDPKAFDVFAELEKEQEPTLVVIPEAVSLASLADCASVQNASLMHCAKMQNRFTILDVYDGYKDPVDCIEPFRESITHHLDLAAAYYPWLKTSLHTANDVTFENIANLAVLQTILADAVPADPTAKAAEIKAEIAKLGTKLDPVETSRLHGLLCVVSPKYVQILDSIREKLNLLPPAGAIAGIYAMIDNTRGVWKAPANVGINGVVAPQVLITAEAQENLNVPTNGKAVNALRSFVGEGTLIWGARTMDGNSLDWRYINVRRTMIMLKESIRQATKAYVFEPNVANTWVAIKSMISNYLTSVWKRGALAGSVPDDAFSVHVGLGETMTPEDILEGILRVTVLVALARPAEFLEITFQQQMQQS